MTEKDVQKLNELVTDSFHFHLHNTHTKKWLIIIHKESKTTLFKFESHTFTLEKLMKTLRQNMKSKHIYGSSRKYREELYKQLKHYDRNRKLKELLDI